MTCRQGSHAVERPGWTVTLAPLNAAGFNNGFILTCEKVAQMASVQIATRLS
ncbi:TPA: hypothetical protein ACS5XR_004895 [Salmonella enterica]